MDREEQRKIVADFYSVPIDRVDDATLDAEIRNCRNPDKVGDIMTDELRSRLDCGLDI